MCSVRRTDYRGHSVDSAPAGEKQPSGFQEYRGGTWPRDIGGLVLAQEICQKRDCDYFLQFLFTPYAMSYSNMYFEKFLL